MAPLVALHEPGYSLPDTLAVPTPTSCSASREETEKVMQKLIRHLVFEWSMLKPYVVCLFNTVDEVLWVLGHRDAMHAVEVVFRCRWKDIEGRRF